MKLSTFMKRRKGSFLDIRFDVGSQKVLRAIEKSILPTFFPMKGRRKIKGSEYVKAARERTVEPTLENLEWCWENDETIQAITKLIIADIQGAGWFFRGSEEAKNLIERFFTPPQGVNLREFVEITIMNLVVFGNQLWRIRHDNQGRIKTIFPLDWKTIKVYRHPTEGWVTYVQTPPQLPRLPKVLGKWEAMGPEELESSFAFSFESPRPLRFEEDEILHFKIQSRGFAEGTSPIACVLTKVIMKLLLEWVMMRSAEIWGSPILKGKTGVGMTYGDLRDLTMEEKEVLKSRVDDLAEALAKFREFGIFSLPVDQDVEVIFPGQGLFNYAVPLEYLRKAIVLSLLGSTALFEAKGVELATSRTIKSVWDESVESWRRILKEGIDDLIRRILESHGVQGECEIVFRTREKWLPSEAKTLVEIGVVGIDELREEYGYGKKEEKG